jgi:hypothetical protein
MEKELRSGLMDRATMATMKMMRKKALGLMFGQVVPSILGTGLTASLMAS